MYQSGCRNALVYIYNLMGLFCLLQKLQRNTDPEELKKSWIVKDTSEKRSTLHMSRGQLMFASVHLVQSRGCLSDCKVKYLLVVRT